MGILSKRKQRIHEQAISPEADCISLSAELSVIAVRLCSAEHHLQTLAKTLADERRGPNKEEGVTADILGDTIYKCNQRSRYLNKRLGLHAAK